MLTKAAIELAWEDSAQRQLAHWIKAREQHMKWIAGNLAVSRRHVIVMQRDAADAISNWEKQRAEQTYTMAVLVRQKKTIANLRRKLRELKKFRTAKRSRPSWKSRETKSNSRWK